MKKNKKKKNHKSTKINNWMEKVKVENDYCLRGIDCSRVNGCINIQMN